MRHSIQRVKEIKRQIGHNIRSAREQCQLTKGELAGFIGITEKRLGEVEAGVSYLTHFNMVICAHRLNRPIEELYGDIPKSLLEEIQLEEQRQFASAQFASKRKRPTVDVNLNGIQIKLDL